MKWSFSFLLKAFSSSWWFTFFSANSMEIYTRPEVVWGRLCECVNNLFIWRSSVAFMIRKQTREAFFLPCSLFLLFNILLRKIDVFAYGNGKQLMFRERKIAARNATINHSNILFLSRRYVDHREIRVFSLRRENKISKKNLRWYWKSITRMRGAQDAKQWKSTEKSTNWKSTGGRKFFILIELTAKLFSLQWNSFVDTFCRRSLRKWGKNILHDFMVFGSIARKTTESSFTLHDA